MSTLVGWGLALVTIFAVVSSILLLRQNVTAKAFFLMNGSLKLPSYVGTMIATNLSLGNLIFLSAIWGYFFGWSGVLWLAVCIGLLYVGFSIMRKKFAPYIEDHTNDGSLHQYLAQLFAASSTPESTKSLRYAASAVTVTCMLLALVLELHLAATLLAKFYKFDVFTTFSALAVLVALYTALGGFKSVVLTDIVQALLVGAGVAAFFYFVSNTNFGQVKLPQSAASVVSDAGWANAIGISFVGIGWLLVTMDSWQRNCASRSLEISARGVFLSSVLMFVSVAVFAYIGMYVKDVVEPFAQIKGFKEQLSGGAFPFNDLFLLAPHTSPEAQIALGIIFLALIMAALSTADTFLVVLSHSLTTDVILAKAFSAGIGSLEEREQRLFGQIGRVVVVAMSILACIIWAVLNYFELLFDPLTMFFVFYAIQFSLFAPLLIGNFSSRRDARKARVSILISAFGGLCIGVYFMRVLAKSPELLTLGLRSDQWIALLPIIIFSICLVAYRLAPESKINQA